MKDGVYGGGQGAMTPEASGPAGDLSFAETLRKVSLFWKRNARIILASALLCGIGAGVASFFIEDRFRSSIHLLVELPATSPLADEQTNQSAQDAFVEGQIFILRSADVLRSVVESLSLDDREFFQDKPGLLEPVIDQVKSALGLASAGDGDALPEGLRVDPEVAHAIRVLRNNLGARRQGDSNVIRVDVSADSATLAAIIANELGETFIVNRENAQFESVARVAGWLDGRETQLRQQLNDAEAAVADFRIENDLIANDAGTIAAEQQLNELTSELITTRGELAERSAAFERARQLLASGEDIQSLPEVQESDIISALRTQLLDIERRLAEFSPGSSSRRAVALRDEQTATRAQLVSEVRRIVDILRNEVNTLQAREELLQEAVARTEAEIGDASRLTVRLRELERRAESYRLLYERYLEGAGLTEERISFQISGVEIIDPASVPPVPYYPPTMLLAIVGLLAGAGLAANVCFVRDAMRPGFVSQRQVRQDLGLPVYACVPKSDHTADPVAAEAQGGYSVFNEAVRTARHRLLSVRSDIKGAPVVQMTSSIPGEGKTTMAYALAKSAEQAGMTVLLIDADLRRASLSRHFGLQKATGLSELLAGGVWMFDEAEMLGSGIDVVAAGRNVDSPSDLLSNPHLRDYLDEARAYYDLIVVDGPPIVDLADAAILSGLSDVTAFVVRWNSTPRDVVTEALERFEGNALDGIILNAVDMSQLSQYGERYDFYAYSADGRGTTTTRRAVRAAASP